MVEKYHLYMDESGSFEKDGNRKRTMDPFIFGVLVPEECHLRLMLELGKIGKAYGYSGFIHAVDSRNNENFAEFVGLQIELLNRYDEVVPFACTYKQDVLTGLPESVREAASANRYLNMVQSVLEHLLFLHPDFFGLDLEFDFHPNTRVAVVNMAKKEKIKEFENLGFYGFSSRKKGQEDLKIFRIWNDDSLRVCLHRLILEYHHRLPEIGKRSWEKIETVVAKNSSNPLVHWVDNLAWVYGHDYGSLRTAHKKLLKRVDVAISYGAEAQRFRELVHYYQDRNLVQFLPSVLDEMSGFVLPYYRQRLEYLTEKALTGLNITSIEQLWILSERLNRYLETSCGNWAFSLELVDSLIGAVKGISVVEDVSEREKNELLFSLYNNKIRLHNHRGEDGYALQVYGDILDLDYDYSVIDRLRTWLEMENRMAVTQANLFDFVSSNRSLEPVLNATSASLQPFSELLGRPVSDPLVGKIKGTMGQNYAFMAPFDPALYMKAEKFFLEAAAQFENDNDRLRHHVNLLNLYLDWKLPEQIERYAEIIKLTPSFAGFLDRPSAESAEFMQFALFVYLKYMFYQGKDFQAMVGRYSLDSLKKWFGPAVNEHPFALICAFLGRMAMRLKQPKTATEYFEHAISIPQATDFQEQPTLQLIRAQVLTCWALDELSINRRSAAEKMVRVVDILAATGEMEGLESILEIAPDKSAVGGWFASAWEALRKVDWKNDFAIEAAEVFLGRFTFNYH